MDKQQINKNNKCVFWLLNFSKSTFFINCRKILSLFLLTNAEKI